MAGVGDRMMLVTWSFLSGATRGQPLGGEYQGVYSIERRSVGWARYRGRKCASGARRRFDLNSSDIGGGLSLQPGFLRRGSLIYDTWKETVLSRWAVLTASDIKP